MVLKLMVDVSSRLDCAGGGIRIQREPGFMNLQTSVSEILAARPKPRGWSDGAKSLCMQSIRERGACMALYRAMFQEYPVAKFLE